WKFLGPAPSASGFLRLLQENDALTKRYNSLTQNRKSRSPRPVRTRRTVVGKPQRSTLRTDITCGAASGITARTTPAIVRAPPNRGADYARDRDTRTPTQARCGVRG